jgi:hypothetical protein
VAVIFKNFFVLQYKGAWGKKIPVANVDHPLDRGVPFLPRYVNIYLDFSGFWVREAAWILDSSGEAAARRFVDGVAEIYERAAAVYRRCLSTTTRPRYLKSARFIIIHSFDPHLMCIPSLHVMLMIYVALAIPGVYAEKLASVRRHALAITDSVLFIKQHSVNCVAAAMYAMTAMSPGLFPPDEALRFANDLFRNSVDTPLHADDIRRYVAGLYLQFLDESRGAADWTAPLLNFLKRSTPVKL